MERWFTSDWHLGHYNIMKHCDRPFSSVLEMNEFIVEGFNSVVSPTDEVYFLGDLAMKWQYVDIYLPQVKGKWIFVRGNHDKPWWNKLMRNEHLRRKIVSWHDLLETRFHGKEVTMCHYPMSSWNKSFHGSIQLHGHTHGNHTDPMRLNMDVGVDSHDFMPWNWDEVMLHMDQKEAQRRQLPMEDRI